LATKSNCYTTAVTCFDDGGLDSEVFINGQSVIGGTSLRTAFRSDATLREGQSNNFDRIPIVKCGHKTVFLEVLVLIVTDAPEASTR